MLLLLGNVQYLRIRAHPSATAIHSLPANAVVAFFDALWQCNAVAPRTMGLVSAFR